MNLFKYLLTFLIVCCFSWMNAQVSVGAKYSLLRSGYGEKGKYDKENLYNTGHHYALLFHFEMGKYFSIGLEPGITKRNFNSGDIPILMFIDIDFISPETVNVVELPIHFKVRAPLWKERIEVYNKLGVRANYFGKENQTFFGIPEERSLGEVVKGIDKDFSTDELDFNYLVGFGTTFHLGRHQIFIECEQYKTLGRTDEQLLFGNDTVFKELKFGLGYLVTI